MDLLSSIRSKKNALKHSRTIVTQADGSRTLFDGTIECEQLEANASTANGFIVDTKPDTSAACILNDFLYLGAQDAVNVNNVVELNLTHILSVGIQVATVHIEPKLTVKFVSCLDLPDTKLHNIIEQCNEFIELCRQKNGRILVHCNAGVSRSASVVIGYLVTMGGFKLADAIQCVKSKRECIRPNDGFMRQLSELC